MTESIRYTQKICQIKGNRLHAWFGSSFEWHLKLRGKAHYNIILTANTFCVAFHRITTRLSCNTHIVSDGLKCHYYDSQ